MSVYVDKAIHPYGRMLMCHMMADTIQELHDMTARIGIQRQHFQDKKIPHYDICKSRRELAMKYGAHEMNRKKTVELIAHYKSQRILADKLGM